MKKSKFPAENLAGFTPLIPEAPALRPEKRGIFLEKKSYKKLWPLDRGVTGFTIIEILVVLGILTIIAASTLFFNTDFYRGYLFSRERETAISVLQKARSRAMNNIQQTPHGVHVETSRYVIFRGAVFNPADPTNEAVESNSGIAKSGATDVVFDQLSGDIGSPAALTLSQGFRSVTISINYEGKIDW